MADNSPKSAKRAKRATEEVDPAKGLSRDPDTFLLQESRRNRILKEKNMQVQDALRPGRTTPVAIRFDRFTLKRLKTLAALHNKGYQTLLKEFVIERLYEEEKRAGIIDELREERPND
jgi:hypothetical protein